ncbi:MAG: exodeoxyribonuclease VII small subunit [Coriobacteriia bacterium]
MTQAKAGLPAEDLSFGEALAELESIVASLEDGRLELEPSIAAYERGVGLLRACEAKLADAEQRVTVLMGELDADEDDAETS